MPRVNINPEIISWLCDRSGRNTEDLEKRFKELQGWKSGNIQPTLKQLKEFSKAVYVPLGYLFLDKPLDEQIPLKDFRTQLSKKIGNPSPHLLDTIYMCEIRQDWYREHARSEGFETLNFIGSVNENSPAKLVAKEIRELLGFDFEPRNECQSYEDALRLFIKSVQKIGILVMVNGIVKNNTRRPLDPKEFRGFTLCDPFTPLIFINGADSKSAQMFTLAHELAHLWLGESALSNSVIEQTNHRNKREEWCNAVAAEILVPLEKLKEYASETVWNGNNWESLAKLFKVSNFVILRRLLDAKVLNENQFEEEWQNQIKVWESNKFNIKKKSGGNFYNMAISRADRNFALAVIVSTLEGKTLYRDAFKLLGVSSIQSFNGLCEKFGVKK